MSDDIEFEVDSKASISSQGSELGRREQDFIESPKPNSIVLKLWSGSHISFEPETSVQIFAILALVVLSLTCILVAAFGAWAQPQASWPEKAFTVLGSAISAIVGAMVGSTVAVSKARRR